MTVFLDSSFLIALFHTNDYFHQKAIEIIKKLNSLQTEYATSNIVLAETVNYLFRRLGKSSAKRFLKGFGESQIGEVFASKEMFSQGYKLLFRQKSKKGLNLFDCLHLATMKTLGIKTILTFDEEFKKWVKVIA